MAPPMVFLLGMSPRILSTAVITPDGFYYVFCILGFLLLIIGAHCVCAEDQLCALSSEGGRVENFFI